MTRDLQRNILSVLPSLRAFAISLTGNVDQADDLVQETIVRALGNIDKFTPGTNMAAWLFTITRNQFHTSYRRRRREVEDPEGIYASKLATAPAQNGNLHVQDLRTALIKLPVEQREAVLLVAAGVSYEEAAQICGTAIGTIKSRVNRARNRLSELLGVMNPEDIGADRIMKAALPRE